MFNRYFKSFTIIILFLFSCSLLTAGTFTEINNNNVTKAEKLFKQKQYKRVIEILVKFIKDNGNNWNKDREIAKAYYILANIYFIRDKTDPSIKKLFKSILFLNAQYKPEGPDTEFNDYFKKMKKIIIKEDIKRQATIKQKEQNKRIFLKQGIKKKKKFPVLLVAGGLAVTALVVYLLTKKYDSGSDVLAKEVYNSIEWATVSEGEFTMGDDSVGVFSKAHKVYLSTYKIAVNEITFKQYDKFCEDTRKDKPLDFKFGRNNRPVINVNWDDANDFCKWLSDKTGKKIALPTEAQWEKAARGTDERIYPWGNTYMPNYCNYEPNNTKGTLPVGYFPLGISPYGLNDMAGNVSEWCSDWYSDNYYANSPKKDPTGPKSGVVKITKGGNWRISPKYLKSAQRRLLRPSQEFYYLGFRVVMQD